MNDRTSRPAVAVVAPFRVLVVDDEELYAQAIGRELKRHAVESDLAYTAAEALRLSQSGSYQAILLDHKLPDDDGIRIIPMLQGRQLKCPVVVMTAYETIPNAIQAIRQGAEDYVVKEMSIKPVIKRVLEIQERDRIRRSGEGWEEQRKEGPLGESPAIVRAREQIEKVATIRDTTVLLWGETGVGKEVAARYLHQISAPAGSPFLSVDCVALPASLVESLLFGHEKGAFTGADQTREGAFHEAGEGTILLDEIGDMDLGLQGKLLRVLETRRYQRVGSVKEHPVRARIVAATNRDLLELVNLGRFRFNLYQRISVFPVHIPPLREREGDALLLARHFVSFFSEKMKKPVAPLSAEVEARLLGYHYPGNVRELKHVLERAVIMTDLGQIEQKHLPERILHDRGEPIPALSRTSPYAVDFIPGIDSLESLEKKLIHSALQQTKGVKGEAAKMLGLSRFQLLRRLEKYQMNPGGDEAK